MKKILWLGLGAGMAAFLSALSMLQISCSSNPTSPAATNTPVPPTKTFTTTPTITHTTQPTTTTTITSTPTVTLTVTPTLTYTSVVPSNPYMLYKNGAFQPFGAIDVFSGGGDSNPALNAISTGDSSGEPSSDTESLLASYTATLMSGGYTGLVITAGSNGNNNIANMTGFSTCTFYAAANESASVGFNAAEESGNTANVPESVTTTWTQFTLNIANGSRSDGDPGNISQVVNYFVEVVTSTPSTPLYVYVDQISFQ